MCLKVSLKLNSAVCLAEMEVNLSSNNKPFRTQIVLPTEAAYGATIGFRSYKILFLENILCLNSKLYNYYKTRVEKLIY